MIEIKQSALVDKPAETLYTLVNAVESYPEFLPWCKAATVLSDTDTEMLATLSIKKGLLDTQFTTRNQLQAPNKIALQLEEGPFTALSGLWQFISLTESACKVEFSLRFEFNNVLFAKMATPLFSQIAKTLLASFIKRATDEN